MKTVYRWLTFIMLAAMLLSACTPATATTAAATPGSGDETASPTKPSEQSGSDQEKITITVWDLGGDEFSWMDNIAIPAFQEKFPNVTIEHIGIPEEELGLKLETAIAAGDVPDVAIVHPTACDCRRSCIGAG